MRPTKSYLRYIRSPAWQKKRAEVFAYYGKKCKACGRTKPPIQVHHMDYSRLGKERVTDLVPLCKPCHDSVTRIYRSNRRRGLRRVTMEYIKRKRELLAKKKDQGK